MSQKLIIAAAGSGKTTHLINEALKISDSKVLITTYTEANEQEIRKKFFEKNGCIPNNIVIQTWFSFLIQHGVKPYQSVIYNGKVKGLLLVNQKSGLKYINKKRQPVYFGENDPSHFYFSSSELIYSDKLSKFVARANELTDGLVIKRIGKIYPYIFIDEVQDMAGYDLEIIKLLFAQKLNVLLVGDPRQVTYHTHDESKNKQYADGNIKGFIQNECSDYDVVIDEETLNKTYRNNKAICEFANSIYSNFKPCEYTDHEATGHDGVFMISEDNVDDYLAKYHPIQLRESRKRKVNLDFPVMNFGESKGLTFDRVIIYPTAAITKWIFNHDEELKAQSRSKFYVAVTRAKYSVAIVAENKKGANINGVINYRKEDYS